MEEKERQQRILSQEVINLESQLAATDYKVIKTYEARLKGNDDPYDTESILNARQKVRDQINEKQQQLAALGS